MIKKRNFLLVKTALLLMSLMLLFNPAYSYRGDWWIDSISLDTKSSSSDSRLVVAILDTGVCPFSIDTHDIVHKYNAWSEDDNIYDNHGHGTWIASIISQITDARLMIIKVTDHLNRCTPYILAKGIIHAADNGADILNISMETPISTKELREAVDYALSKGCLIIASSGNNGGDELSYPARFPGVISVGSSDIYKNKSAFSNYGHGLDLLAPGELVGAIGMNCKYTIESGTSASCAVVTGLLTRIKGMYPDMTNSQLRYILKYSCNDIYLNGRDIYTGNGIVDAALLFENAEKFMKNESINFYDYSNSPWYMEAFDFITANKILSEETSINEFVSKKTAYEIIGDFLNNLYGSKTDMDFYSDEDISREEFLKILFEADMVNMDGFMADTGSFKDFNVTTEELKPYVAYAYSKSLVNGRDQESFYPKESISIAEASQILFNYHMYKVINMTDMVDVTRITVKPDYKEISHKLFDLYLREHTKETMAPSLRILSYEIKSVEITKTFKEGFVFEVIYDTVPYGKKIPVTNIKKTIHVEFIEGEYCIKDVSK